MEVTLGQDRRDAQRLPAVGDAGGAPSATRRVNTILPHDLAHCPSGDPQPLGHQLGMDARRALATLALREDRPDPGGQHIASR
ncbi:MAG: hypothetical protein AAF967_14485, partial [Pseudomonadota bacterium]